MSTTIDSDLNDIPCIATSDNESTETFLLTTYTSNEDSEGVESDGGAVEGHETNDNFEVAFADAE